MKKVTINRIAGIMAGVFAVLVWCFVSNNTYINVALATLAVMVGAVVFAKVEDGKKQTKGEKWMLNKLSQFVNAL